MKTRFVNIKNESIKHRFDSSYHLSDGVVTYSVVTKSPYPLNKIKNVTDKIFIGGRAKRTYIDNVSNGIKFLSSSDILASDLENVKIVSKKYQQGIDEMKLEKDWILISRSGTIGNTAFTNSLFEGKLASEDVMKVVPNSKIKPGFLYSYISSRFGYSLLTQGMFGGVIKHIEPEYVESLPIPEFPVDFQEKIDKMIKEASRLREEAAYLLKNAEKNLKQKADLQDLKQEDYNHFGTHCFKRKITCYNKNISEIGSITFNAFNHSVKIEKIKQQISNSVKLSEILLGNTTFSTGSFPRIEVKAPYGVKLINQSDAFDTIIKGKNISLRKVNLTKLVEYGEVIVAGVGTLGENETFCRTLFANEDLEGQLISGEFIRMKTNEKVPSGYLYAWLNSDYGFRFLRSIHTGTKLCRPIPQLFLEIPIPILKKEDMEEIDSLVRLAHTKRHEANKLELEAISKVEEEIEKWTKE